MNTVFSFKLLLPSWTCNIDCLQSSSPPITIIGLVTNSAGEIPDFQSIQNSSDLPPTKFQFVCHSTKHSTTKSTKENKTHGPDLENQHAQILIPVTDLNSYFLQLF